MQITSKWRELAPELRAVLASCRAHFIGVAAVSAVINLLMLTGPLFMLQVYDRVLPSRSVPTLIGLCIFALLLFLFLGALDAMRNRVLTRIAREIDQRLAPRAFDTVVAAAIRRHAPGDELRVLRDLDGIRSFLSGPALPAFFDLPWMPIYVGVCFLFHPVIGWAILAGAIALCCVTYVTEALSYGPSRDLRGRAMARQNLGDVARRNAELIHASGMKSLMNARWTKANQSYQHNQQTLADITSGFGSVSRTFRLILQSAILSLGAYLVINQQATAGVMLAATILSIRALSPVETVIANWRGFVAARQGMNHLSEVLKDMPQAEEKVALPRPAQSLRAISLTIAAPNSANAVLHDVSFALEAGTAMGVIGPTGSGKSSLARALVGAWKPVRGVVRLDGARLDQWDSDVLGNFVGYLPQQVELFEGSVAQNISRFKPDIDSKALLEASQAAAIHDMILRLPSGYQSPVGEEGAALSGGQRQRIGLARALFGKPFLVVLDEPNANLDADGEAALARAILEVKQRMGIVVIVTHRPNILAAVDKLMVLNEGRVQAFGPREQVIAALRPAAKVPVEATAPAEVVKPAARARRAQHAKPVA
jgi:ATP-binding cassette subfamily C protein